MDVARFLADGDGVTRTVAVLLLLLSITSWVLIFWKAWLLRDAATAVSRSVAGFWQASSVAEARQSLPAFDTQGLVLPFLSALDAGADGTPAALAGHGDLSQRRTRLLRGALHGASGRLQFGQVLLASTGAIAPFVGLLGTVWGIRHALADIAGAGQITIERIAGPVGEALVMTAAGLAVAIPAVLAYNLFGRRIARIEAELEGFAQDLRDLPSAGG